MRIPFWMIRGTRRPRVFTDRTMAAGEARTAIADYRAANPQIDRVLAQGNGAA